MVLHNCKGCPSLEEELSAPHNAPNAFKPIRSQAHAIKVLYPELLDVMTKTSKFLKKLKGNILNVFLNLATDVTQGTYQTKTQWNSPPELKIHVGKQLVALRGRSVSALSQCSGVLHQMDR